MKRRGAPAELAHTKLWLLDGGLATELEHRGFDISGPLWSARVLREAPQAIEQVHYDYFAAGADFAISASYQASYTGYAASGLTDDETTALLRRSVSLARSARARYREDSLRSNDPQAQQRLERLRVAASVGPYGATLHDGSEYRGNYGLSVEKLIAFHERRFAILAESGADLLACETIPSLDEARALAQLLRNYPRQSAWMSFTSRDGVHTAEGAPLTECGRFLDSIANVVAIGVNCVDPNVVTRAIHELRAGTAKPIVVYPNSGEHWIASTGQWTGRAHRSQLAELTPEWISAGAQWIGGCCRTRPADIAEMARRMLR
jgi:homocysteine S-methyltransferase